MKTEAAVKTEFVAQTDGPAGQVKVESSGPVPDQVSGPVSGPVSVPVIKAEFLVSDPPQLALAVIMKTEMHPARTGRCDTECWDWQSFFTRERKFATVPEYRGKRYIKDFYHGDRGYNLFIRCDDMFVYMVDREHNVISSVEFAMDSISSFRHELPKMAMVGRYLLLFNIHGHVLVCMDDPRPTALGFEAEWSSPPDVERSFFFVERDSGDHALCLWTPLLGGSTGSPAE
jgi:hypothetical protein